MVNVGIKIASGIPLHALEVQSWLIWWLHVHRLPRLDVKSKRHGSLNVQVEGSRPSMLSSTMMPLPEWAIYIPVAVISIKIEVNPVTPLWK